jgi:hypothetical protein
MGDIGETIRKFKSLNFKKIIISILNTSEIKEFIIKMEQERLFNLGEDSTGASLGEYAPFTVVIKQEKGQRFDHITLNDTGEFYESFTFHATGTELIFDANPVKDDDNLFDNFGIDILGLNDFDRNRLIETIYIELKFYLLNKL